MPRRFTLEEANALIPRLEELLANIRELRSHLASAQSEVGEVELKARSNGIDRAEKIERARAALVAITNALKAKQDEIDAIGCEVKDVDQGLVDFLSPRDGRDVYLCWKSGETAIRFWHELSTGFAGRQPL